MTHYFTGNERRAAQHLLDSGFGERVRQVAEVTLTDDLLTIDTPDDGMPLSSGELVLWHLLVSLPKGEFYVSELWRLDDDYFDRVIAAMHLVRGGSVFRITSPRSAS